MSEDKSPLLESEAVSAEGKPSAEKKRVKKARIRSRSRWLSGGQSSRGGDSIVMGYDPRTKRTERF